MATALFMVYIWSQCRFKICRNLCSKIHLQVASRHLPSPQFWQESLMILSPRHCSHLHLVLIIIIKVRNYKCQSFKFLTSWLFESWQKTIIALSMESPKMFSSLNFSVPYFSPDFALVSSFFWISTSFVLYENL